MQQHQEVACGEVPVPAYDSLKSMATLTPASQIPNAYDVDPEVMMFARGWLAQLSVKMRDATGRMSAQREQIVSLTSCQMGLESQHQEQIYHLQVKIRVVLAFDFVLDANRICCLLLPHITCHDSQTISSSACTLFFFHLFCAVLPFILVTWDQL